MSSVTTGFAPDSLANFSAISTISFAGCNSFGAKMRTLTPSIEPVTNKLLAMLFRPSPTNVNVKPFK